jgi:hypothetical protein
MLILEILMPAFMKQIFILILIGTTIFSCRKDKVPAPIESNYYQSNGNFLILNIDEDLESAYEYNLASTALINDSLPLYFETNLDGTTNESFLKFNPNPDTLLHISASNSTFFANQIHKNELQSLTDSIPFNATQFHLIGTQNNTDYSLVWSKISNLDIVKTYRNANPNSKIGINSLIINEYNTELELIIPNKKHLVYLVK